MTAASPLLELFASPPRDQSLDELAWDRVISQARASGLLPRLHSYVQRSAAFSALPDRVRDLITAGGVQGADHRRSVRWEINRISRALHGLDVPVVLLKGAAYSMAGLLPAEGRLYSDVDILVPKASLEVVEQALLAAGWESVKPDDYDQYYYRQWMHELPPLKHRDRRTMLDVHHTILPTTSRLRPDAALLFEASRELPGTPFRVLSPVDMVLHAAAHMFHDGELHGALRELIDLDQLLNCFADQPGFWEQLAPRAQQLDLARPLYYALRYTQRLLNTPVPSSVNAAACSAQPPRGIEVLMDAAIPAMLVPDVAANSPLWTEVARQALFARSHWLRMPPWLLLGHLLHKCLPKRSGAR